MTQTAFDQTDQLILYLVKNLSKGVPHLLVEGGGVLTTVLAKLLFLVDVWCLQTYGIRATDFRYIKYKYGPYPLTQFDERLEQLKNWGLQVLPKESVHEGRRYRIYRLIKEPQIQFDFPREIQLVADEVMTTFANQRLEHLLDYIYGFDFVRKVPFGQPIDIEALKKEDVLTQALKSYRHAWTSPIPQEHLEAIEQARGEALNENIHLAHEMKEKQRKAFKLKHGL